MNQPLLSVDSLGVEFQTRRGTVTALRGVSFEVSEGEVLGIVGESGSGKSVTAYTVLGILDRAARVVSGSARFEGVDLTKLSEREMRAVRGRLISMIFQNPVGALNPIRPVGKQIADVIVKHTLSSARAANDKAIQMLEHVRIARAKDRFNAYPFELSGGMCQRVMIAMALACHPRILIADEPTTGLDVVTQRTVMDLLLSLVRERQMSTVLITHDLGLASCYCDRVVVMREGRVLEEARTADLFSKPSDPYTRMLIAASPHIDATLSDLVRGKREHSDDPKLPMADDSSAELGSSSRGSDVLIVTNLTKTFQTSRQDAAWFQSFPEQRTSSLLFAANEVSFHVSRGQSVGLVGESGSGKSTIARIIARIADADRGEVVLSGTDIARIAPRRFVDEARRKDVQLVFQDPTDSLNPRFTAFETISDPLRRLVGLHADNELRERVEELAVQVGLDPSLLDRFPHQLSGGQKARVGIARGIAVRPKLLILDEPTSSLDVSVQAVVLLLLDRLRRTLNLSFLFISHDLNVVRMMCDHVLVLKQGVVVESGSSGELFRNPRHEYTRSLLDAIPRFRSSR